MSAWPFPFLGWVYLIKDKYVITTRNNISHVLKQGISKSIQSDDGSEFKNRVMNNNCQAHNTNRIYETIYSLEIKEQLKGLIFYWKRVEKSLLQLKRQCKGVWCWV